MDLHPERTAGALSRWQPYYKLNPGRYLMYRLLLLLVLCYSIAGINTTFAQGSADFFFPLHIGNYWNYHTDGSQTTWDSRTTRETIEGEDLIGGLQYVRVRGVEILDTHLSDTLAFHVFWLRQDIAGNILMAAFTDGATDLASAARFDPPMPFFPNEFLNAGYSREYSDPSQNTSSMDSVESTTETVNGSGGSFTGCIKIHSQQKNSQGVIIFLEHAFYARGVGEVKRTREVPVGDMHVNNLLQYNTVTSMDNGKTGAIPGEFALKQNYPNPFNPQTTIGYALPRSSYVTLTVYSALGQKVATLVEGEFEAGYHVATFPASSGEGNRLASGVYFYRLQARSLDPVSTSGAREFVQTKSLLLLR